MNTINHILNNSVQNAGESLIRVYRRFEARYRMDAPEI